MISNEKCRWVIEKAFRFCWAYILLYTVILLLTSAIGLVICLINRQIVNTLISNTAIGVMSSAFIGLVTVYMALYFFQRANSFIVTFGSNFLKYRLDCIFHTVFMYKSYKTPQSSFFKSDFMETYSFVGGNTGKISSYIQNLLIVVFINFGITVSSVVLFAIYEPWLILYVAVIAFCTLNANSYIAKKEYSLDKKQIKEQRYHDYYKDVLTGKSFAKELRIYGSKNFFYAKWEKIYNALSLEKLALALKRIKFGNLYTFVRFGCRVLAVAVLIAGVTAHRYDVGTFVMLFGLIENCANQVNSLSNVLVKGVYKDTKYLCDYHDFVAPLSNQEIKKIISPKDNDINLYFGEFKELVLDNICFSYGDGNEAVKNVSFTLKKGETVSILGYNGSGKTTLSKIICGGLPCSAGKITMNGIEVTDENRQNLRAYFGTTPQEFSRFSLPLAEYVGLGRIEMMNDPDKLENAYRKAGVNEFLGKYEKRDKIVLGKEYDDEGVDISGGEWQKLAIASAYMGEPEILLMDEPTASIDPLKEAEFIASFRTNLMGNTAVMISHRIGMARLADRIIMMKNGTIDEQGTHEELLAKGGYYAEIFNAQKALYKEENTI